MVVLSGRALAKPEVGDWSSFNQSEGCTGKEYQLPAGTRVSKIL